VTQFTIDKAAFACQSRECTGKRERGTNGGPQNHFGLAALTTLEGALAEYLGAARSPTLGGNIVLIQPSGTRPDPWFAKATAFAQAFATLVAYQLTATGVSTLSQAPSAGR
jgi:hypothetical protein